MTDLRPPQPEIKRVGWECPVCHKGNAPFASKCGHCAGASIHDYDKTDPSPPYIYKEHPYKYELRPYWTDPSFTPIVTC